MKNLYLIGAFPDGTHSIGDAAQTLALNQYFKTYYPDYILKQFDRTQINQFLNLTIDSKDLIFIHSSGDFGDLHPDWHKIRKQIITKFSNNKIIQLPVSVYYFNESSFEIDKIFFSNKPNLLILCRSEQAANKLKGSFGCHVAYFPDFVYNLQVPNITPNRQHALLCLRRDKEYYIKYLPCKACLKFARKPLGVLTKLFHKDLDYILYRFIRWLDWNLQVLSFKIKINNLIVCDLQTSKTPLTIQNREQIIHQTLQNYGYFKLVISDRFHAKVFCHLIETPFQSLPTNIKQKTAIRTHPDKNIFKTFRQTIESLMQQPLNKNILKTDNAISLMINRRSIRKWKTIIPNESTREAILTIGRYAPTAANTQHIKLINTINPETIKQLCQNTSPWFKNSYPSWVIVVCIDKTKSLKKPEWVNRFIWQDSAVTETYLMLACEHYFLNSCWASVNPKQAEQIHKILKLSDNLFVACMLFVGEAAQIVNYETAIHQGRLIKRVTHF